MIASEIIGLAALFLILIFFYTRIMFSKLRSVFILILAFASAGLVGYSSASSIGLGWTVSLALLIFAGVAISVIFLLKREDREIEQHFELALKSDQPPLVTPVEEAVHAPQISPADEGQELSHVSTTTAEELAAEHVEATETVEGNVSEAEPYVAVSLLPVDLPEIQRMEHHAGEEIPSDDPIRADSLHKEQPALTAETTILPTDHTRIQALSAEAELALQQNDYLRAYQSLREALSYSPPVMATYILSRQLVQVLNEMGLYEESISVMEKVLNDSPTLSAKKREEFIRHISYLEKLIQQLQLENKRNLSWSLVPPAIHEKVVTQFRTLLASSNDRSTAIPFH